MVEEHFGAIFFLHQRILFSENRYDLAGFIPGLFFESDGLCILDSFPHAMIDV